MPKRPALFHLSEDADIAPFVPRSRLEGSEPVVWAIAETHMANYLLPRDCPRVAFRAGPETSAHDKELFLGSDSQVIAIEAVWLARVQETTLYSYAMPHETFDLRDEGAGYWTSASPVTPIFVERISNLEAAIRNAGATLRVLPDLWSLHDAAKTSSLVFSMIRMRNASPRPA